ncbi:MAG: acyl--CoA ligase [Candidatus Rokubacteria bacterium]|nr:acyl--CoA ligase [Candidatus Rokubacteria bacterium]
MNLAHVLHASAAAHADRPAVSDLGSGRTLTYAELGRESDRIATLLAREGVVPGQRIGLVAPNSIAHVAAAFGLLATGACLVPLAANLTPTEAAQIAREVELNGCLTWRDGFRFEWLNRAAPGPAELPALDAAFIRFTSGTTASSKGVVLSHEATLARVEAADRVLRLGRDDRIFWVLPLAYHFAVTIVAYVRAGAHVLLCADTRPPALLDAIRKSAPTVLYASPLHFERLGNLGGGGRLDSVRLAVSTSAPITAAVVDRFEAAHGVPLGQAYGLIEAGLPCINTGADGLAATSVGRPVPGYDVAVFSDAGARERAGVSGEIGIRGDGLFSAYYAPWRRRARITRDGWFMTGDIGRFDARGALHLEGRTKAVIFVAGLKFFPEEVEACINGFPGIEESRVFGRAHAHLGQVPCAEIVARAGRVDVDALRAHCARLLSTYKVPVEFSVVDTVPRTPGGKILRRTTT